MSPMESIISATKTNAELFEMEGEIGTVEEEKFADLLVVDGNPLEDITLFQKQSNLKVIMQDGKIVKNTLG